MAPGIVATAATGVPSGRTFRRSLSARLVSATALVLFGFAVATRSVSGDFGAGYFVLAALVLVSVAGVVSAWGDRITIDAAGVETRNVVLSRLPGLEARAHRRLAWAEILRIQEHRRPGSDGNDLPRALFLVPFRGKRLALDSLEDFDAVVTLVRRGMTGRAAPGDPDPPVSTRPGG